LAEPDPFHRLFTIAVEQAGDWYALDSDGLPTLSIEAACVMVRGKLSGRMPTELADELYTLADKLYVSTHRSTAYVDGIVCLECITAALKKRPRSAVKGPAI
jgi:hypothetical protein